MTYLLYIAWFALSSASVLFSVILSALVGLRFASWPFSVVARVCPCVFLMFPSVFAPRSAGLHFRCGFMFSFRLFPELCHFFIHIFVFS